MTASSNIQIRPLSLFATPLAVVLLPDAAQINAALAPDLAKRAAGAAAGSAAWRSPWDLDAATTPGLARILEAARGLAAELTSDASGNRAAVDWRPACRGIVQRQGQGVEAQAHHGAFWSGLYYADDGAAAADPALGGALEFQDPRGAAPVMYAPDLTFAGPGGATMGISQTMQARAGALAVFPAWLLQSMSYYRGAGSVVAVSFTLSR